MHSIHIESSIEESIRRIDECLGSNLELLTNLENFVDEAEKISKRLKYPSSRLVPFGELVAVKGDPPLNHDAVRKATFAKDYLSQMSHRPEWSAVEVAVLRRSLARIYPKTMHPLDPNSIEWTRVHELCVHFDSKFQRDVVSCQIEYLHKTAAGWEDEQSPSSSSWSVEEDALLSQLATQTNGTDWGYISSHFSPPRTAYECYSRCYSKLHAVLVPGDFSAADDERLRAIVAHVGETAWTTTAIEMGTGHSEAQLSNRWHKTLKPGISSGRWNPVLDARLKAAVAVYGQGRWSQIARRVPGKTDRKCRERFEQHLAPGLREQADWDSEEDKVLLETVAEVGMSNWSQVKSRLPGRTGQMCRMRFVRIAPGGLLKEYERSTAEKRVKRAAKTRLGFMERRPPNPFPPRGDPPITIRPLPGRSSDLVGPNDPMFTHPTHNESDSGQQFSEPGGVRYDPIGPGQIGEPNNDHFAPPSFGQPPARRSARNPLRGPDMNLF